MQPASAAKQIIELLGAIDPYFSATDEQTSRPQTNIGLRLARVHVDWMRVAPSVGPFDAPTSQLAGQPAEQQVSSAPLLPVQPLYCQQGGLCFRARMSRARLLEWQKRMQSKLNFAPVSPLFFAIATRRRCVLREPLETIL